MAAKPNNKFARAIETDTKAASAQRSPIKNKVGDFDEEAVQKIVSSAPIKVVDKREKIPSKLKTYRITNDEIKKIEEIVERLIVAGYRDRVATDVVRAGILALYDMTDSQLKSAIEKTPNLKRY